MKCNTFEKVGQIRLQCCSPQHPPPPPPPPGLWTSFINQISAGSFRDHHPAYSYKTFSSPWITCHFKIYPLKHRCLIVRLTPSLSLWSSGTRLWTLTTPEKRASKGQDEGEDKEDGLLSKFIFALSNLIRISQKQDDFTLISLWTGRFPCAQNYKFIFASSALSHVSNCRLGFTLCARMLLV